MKIDGRKIAEKVYTKLHKRVNELEKKNITPHLVVILVGTDPASLAYITQKEKAGERIGAKVTVLHYKEDIKASELEEKIALLNSDPFVHGILIQRPLPKQIDVNKLTMTTAPYKDIDGFHPESPFTLPLPLAVVKILEEIFSIQSDAGVTGVGTPLERLERTKRVKPSEWGDSSQDPISAQFLYWLQSQNLILLGKGEAGGKPILAYFHKLHIQPTLIDSKTAHPEEILKQADIVISAVGKKIIKPETLKKGVILIGVGLYRNYEEKLQGDYDEEEIKTIASFYTPTPGGVGPVNVAMLMQNLLTATEQQTN